MSILPWPNSHFFFTFFQAAEPCPRPVFLIHVLRRPKGMQFVSLIGGREIYFFIFFLGAQIKTVALIAWEWDTHEKRGIRAWGRSYHSRARACLQVRARALTYHAPHESKRHGKTGNKNVQPGSTCLALLLQYELKSTVTTRFTTYESSNLSCNKSCCGRLWKFVAGR